MGQSIIMILIINSDSFVVSHALQQDIKNKTLKQVSLMDDQFKKPWVWLVYLLLTILTVPWYWPINLNYFILGFPLWSVISIIGCFATSLFTLVLLIKASASP